MPTRLAESGLAAVLVGMDTACGLGGKKCGILGIGRSEQLGQRRHWRWLLDIGGAGAAEELPEHCVGLAGV